jgi:hypothetical protein
VAVRDLFTGGLSIPARTMMALCNQLPAWIRGKITACIQPADTHVIKPFKIATKHKHMKLRRELLKLAEFEDTRAVFKCGVYEIMRTLNEVVIQMIYDFRQEKRMLKAIVQDGFLEIRPNIDQGTFERTSGQPWKEGMRVGSHRLKQSWFNERFSHLDENGMPLAGEIKVEKPGEIPDDAEQTYHVEEGSVKKPLSVWKEQLQEGIVTEADIREFQEEPWFALELQNFKGLDGIEDCKQLLKTPKQKRIERGLDPHLTTQRKDKEKAMRKKRTNELKRIARVGLRRESISELAKYKAEGYTVDQIAAEVIQIHVGKGKAKKKKLRDGMVKKLAAQKAIAKAKAKAQKKDVEPLSPEDWKFHPGGF